MEEEAKEEQDTCEMIHETQESKGNEGTPGEIYITTEGTHREPRTEEENNKESDL